MSQNRRVLFSSHVAGIAQYQSNSYYAIEGCQNVGITTNYTLDPILELGQINLYQLVEQIPEVEVTAQKVLDGSPLMYHLSTLGATDGSLVGRSNQRCQFAMSVYSDVQQSASGTPTSQTMCSGMYIQNISYTFGTSGPFMEDCTWVGNDKAFLNSAFTFTPTFNNNDSPLALAGSGGVQLRQDLIFYPILGSGDPNHTVETQGTLDSNGQVLAYLTILPPDVVGISSSGTNDRDSSGEFGSHISDITVGCNLGRDAVLELGRRDPYYRFTQFPIQVTCSITAIATDADSLTASETGYDGFGDNTRPRSIRIRAREGTFICLGTENKLQSVSFAGGGTDGGQANITYNYITYNTFSVSHPKDPSSLQYPLLI